MTQSLAEQFKAIAQDIRSERPLRFQLPLNHMFHECGQSYERLAEAGIDVDEFKELQMLGFAKETLGMTGAGMHRIFRQVIYRRCEIILTGPLANRLPEDIRDRLIERKIDLERHYHDLTP